MDDERIATELRSVFSRADGWMPVDHVHTQVLRALGRKRLTAALEDAIDEELAGLTEEAVLLERMADDGWTEFVLRQRFFGGKRFLVRLKPFERQKGALVIGHRFVPFMSPDLSPGATGLVFADGPLAMKRVRLPAADSAEYCSLLGKLGWLAHVADENPGKSLDQVAEGSGSIALPAYDLGPVLAAHPGTTALVLECLDFRKGVMGVVEARGADAPVDFAGTAAACQALDAALGTVFEDWEPGSIAIPEQIALAYAQMPESFFVEPPIHFGGYLAQSRRVAVAHGFLDTILWRAGEDPKEALRPEDRQAIVEMMDLVRTALEKGKGSPGLPWPGQPPTGKPERAAGAKLAGRAKPDRIYTLDVALEGGEQVHRRLEVHWDNSWQTLHEALFDAFDREEEHLYAFYLTDKACPSVPKRYRAPTIEPILPGEEAGPGRDAASTLFGDFDWRAGSLFYYLFDFGDEWWHEITVTAIEDRLEADVEDYPRLIASQGDSPPQYPDSVGE
jgi:hypothetical protein